MTDDEFRQRVVDALHEWFYIDDRVSCGVRADGTEYHDHKFAEELANDLLAFDRNAPCINANPSKCVLHR